MELRQLELLTQVVQAGSLTAAAERCHLSQPAISQQLQALEEELGEALLIRKARGVEPTAAGRTVLEHAARLLAERDRLRHRFDHRRNLQDGAVTFGIIPTIAPFLLPRWLGPFREEFPGIQLAVVEDRTTHLLQQLGDGRIEFAIVSDIPDADRRKYSLQVKEWFREPLLLAAPRRHRLATRKAPPLPGDLSAHELIHLKGGHCLSDRTLRLCRIHEPNPGLQCDQLATALSMVAAGLGITVVPRLATRLPMPAEIVLRPFGQRGLHRTIALARRRHARPDPATQALIRQLEPSGFEA